MVSDASPPCCDCVVLKVEVSSARKSDVVNSCLLPSAGQQPLCTVRNAHWLPTDQVYVVNSSTV